MNDSKTVPYFLSWVLALAFASGASAQGTNVLALVNGISIQASDIDCALEASPAALLPGRDAGDNPVRRVHSNNPLDLLITLELLYQESLKHRYPDLHFEVEERLNGEIQKLGGETRFQAALRCNDMTPDAFRMTLFRNLSINRYLDGEVFSRISVSESEIKTHYDRHKERYTSPPSVHLQQIVIRVPSWEDLPKVHDARSRAEMVRTMAVSGADFETLARRFSEDPAGGPSGGDLGMVVQGNKRFPFEKEAFSLTVGEVSNPLPSRQGYCLIKVVGQAPAARRPLDEVRSEIVSLLRQEKAATMIAELISHLRASADIKILPQNTRP